MKIETVSEQRLYEILEKSEITGSSTSAGLLRQTVIIPGIGAAVLITGIESGGFLIYGK